MLALAFLKAVKDAAALADRRLLVIEQVENGYLACFQDAEKVERSNEQQLLGSFAEAMGGSVSPEDLASIQPLIQGFSKALGQHRTVVRAVFCSTPADVLPVLARAIEARQRVLEAR